jgi:flagellar motility protein MotE (MotC chaperone)
MAEPESDNETVVHEDPFDANWTESDKMGYFKMQMDFLRGRLAVFEKRDLRRENIEMEMHFAVRARLGDDVQALKAQILAEIVPEVRAQILAEIVPEVRSQILAEIVPEVRAQILAEIVPELRAQILAEIVPEVRAQILAEIVPELRAQIMSEIVQELRTNPTKEDTEVVDPSIVKGSRTRSSVTAPRKRARR